jgi:hypothetical protein
MAITARKMKSLSVVENTHKQALCVKAPLRKCTTRRTFKVTKILYAVITEGAALPALPRSIGL